MTQWKEPLTMAEWRKAIRKDLMDRQMSWWHTVDVVELFRVGNRPFVHVKVGDFDKGIFPSEKDIEFLGMVADMQLHRPDAIILVYPPVLEVSGLGQGIIVKLGSMKHHLHPGPGEINDFVKQLIDLGVPAGSFQVFPA